MKIKFICLAFLCAWMAASCSDDEAYIALNNSGSTGITLSSGKGAEETFSFSTNQTWEASGDADWLTISPASGGSGTNEITLTAESENRTGEVRTATVTISSTTSYSATQSILVSQEIGRYIRVEADSIQVGTEGGAINIYFATNMGNNEFAIYSSSLWLTQSVNHSRTTDETEYVMPLTVLPNPNGQERSAYIFFMDADEGVQGEPFATVTIVQDGLLSGEESTDYSQDKTVRIIHEATKGAGIPVVIMGDGFMDTEIEEGYYDEVMDQAFSYLFSEEPASSLLDYFDVYAVTAVSRNSGVGIGHETVFSCELEGGGSTGIYGDDEAVMEYVQCVEDIDIENTLAVVILNTSDYAGTTYFGYTDLQGEYTEFAISYCPVIYSLTNEYFRTVLTHEAIGHGFAKLADEYFYEENGTIPESEVKFIQEVQPRGWMRNIDFTTDTGNVLWSAFLADSLYTSEQLGIYEGADTYMYGVYRPSIESMMNSNQSGFNAPSRLEIYKQVMKLGESRETTYGEFTAFDSTTPAVQAETRSSSVAINQNKPFKRPQVANKKLAHPGQE